MTTTSSDGPLRGRRAAARSRMPAPARGQTPTGRAGQRRWIVINAIAVTAIINVVLNALPAWIATRGLGELPVWSVPFAETGVAAALVLAVSGADALTATAFVVYKTCLGVALGLVVTPLIALRAMADRLG